MQSRFGTCAAGVISENVCHSNESYVAKFRMLISKSGQLWSLAAGLLQIADDRSYSRCFSRTIFSDGRSVLIRCQLNLYNVSFHRRSYVLYIACVKEQCGRKKCYVICWSNFKNWFHENSGSGRNNVRASFHCVCPTRRHIRSGDQGWQGEST